MTVREALREGAAALSRTETPLLDASLLLAAALGVDTARLLASGPEALAEESLARYRENLLARSRGLPCAYILGYREFWGRRFAVDRRVLIPRPDTETLVEAALSIGDAMVEEREEERKNRAKAQSSTAKGAQEAIEKRERDVENNHPTILSPHNSTFAPSAAPASHLGACSSLRVHEVCTGSGCVAISVAAERPLWLVSASDLSEEALEVARTNAASHLAPGRAGGSVSFARRDLLAPGDPRERFDLILANPPYVPTPEAEALLSRGWSEPLMALDGGPDGLGLARRLVGEAALALAPGGFLLVEADGGQSEAVAELFRASRFTDIRAWRDLAGAARVTSGRKTWTP